MRAGDHENDAEAAQGVKMCIGMGSFVPLVPQLRV